MRAAVGRREDRRARFLGIDERAGRSCRSPTALPPPLNGFRLSEIIAPAPNNQIGTALCLADLGYAADQNGGSARVYEVLAAMAACSAQKPVPQRPERGLRLAWRVLGSWLWGRSRS